MNWLAFVLALGAIFLFGWYALTGFGKALGFGLVVLTVSWIVQLVVHVGLIQITH